MFNWCEAVFSLMKEKMNKVKSGKMKIFSNGSILIALIACMCHSVNFRVFMWLVIHFAFFVDVEIFGTIYWLCQWC